MSIVLQGSTSGSITLQEPAVAGSTVLSLPATSGTLITTGSSGQVIPRAALPTGSVLQVVNATYGTGVFTSGTAYVDTGLSASITPTSSTSKILVIVCQSDPFKSVGNVSSAVNLKLLRNSTDLILFAQANCFTGTNVQNNGTSICTTFLDSPATTSSITYKTQFANYTSAVQVGVQASNGISTMTLMEIAA